MAAIFIRTFILYGLLSVTLKTMGKRQLGELEVSELVSALMISEVSVLPINDPDLPLLGAVVPVLCILSAEVLISYFKNKSAKLKKLAEGDPVFFIYKGKLRQKVLADNRLSIDEILTEIRVLGYGSLSDVEYAILEQNGKISVLPKADRQPLTRKSLEKPDKSGMAHTVIVDACVKTENLRALGFDDAWLEKRLKEEHLRPSEVFLMTVDDEGTVDIVRKEKA